MDERIEEITRKLDKILSILDAKSKKLLSDRERIKAKRDDDAAQTAKTRGVIVVDRLTGRRQAALPQVGARVPRV